MKRFVHLIDDEKHIDNVIRQFEAVAPNDNAYVMEDMSAGAGKSLISRTDLVTRVHECKDAFVQKEIAESIDAVFVHCMDGGKGRFIRELDSSVKVVWLPWGHDYYYWTWTPDRSFLRETLAYYVKNSSWRAVIGDFCRPARYGSILCPEALERTWSRVDYVAPVVPTEMPTLSRLPGMRAKMLRFNYGTIEALCGGFPERRIEGDDILVGNSCSMASNHADVFKMLAESRETRQRIVVPLSYGGDRGRYGNHVIELGKYYFGKRFVPLLEWMPLQEYVRVVASCGHAVFCHLRQQALGNILMSAWMGASIYLHGRSPVYYHLRNVGLEISPIEDKKMLRLVSNPDPVRQRDVLIREYGSATVSRRTQELVNVCRRGVQNSAETV